MLTMAASGLVLLLLIVLAKSVKLYVETPFGDVQLSCHDGHPDTLGTVTVFYPGYGYLPVCLDGFNRAAAAAVCRQLGFVDASPTLRNDDYIGPPSELRCDTPTEPRTHISHMLCPNVSNYPMDGELHAMRCAVGSLTTATCVKGYAAVECSTELLQNSHAAYRYNGQVRLAGQPLTSSPHYGIAKVIISNNEYSLCSDVMTYFLAHSICRQLGYTNSRSYKPTKEKTKKSVNLLSSCSTNTAGSYPCFSHCINIDNLIKDTNCKEVEVFCEFKNVNVLTESPGSPGWCALSIPSTDVGTGGGIGIGIAIGITISIVIGVVLSVIVCIVYVKMIRGHAPQREEDPGPVEEPGERRPLLANGRNNMPQ